MAMAKYQRTIAGDFDAVVYALHNSITSDDWSMMLVGQEQTQCGNARVDVRVYEKTVIVAGGSACLTVVTTGDGSDNRIIAIGKSVSPPIDRVPLHIDEQLVSIVEHAVNDILAE